jgi:hypothetical protein
MTDLPSLSAAPPHLRGQKHCPNIGAALVGNLLECYDFAVHGFMAAIIGKAFFPAGDPLYSRASVFRRVRRRLSLPSSSSLGPLH